MNVYTETEQRAIKKALKIIKSKYQDRVAEDSPYVSSSAIAQDYMRIHLGGLPDPHREVFSALFLDNSHRLIACEDLFTGTIDGSAVYPREVVRQALHHNAKAVIFGHNHPSGNREPSGADKHLTRKLVDALALLDIRVLDHLIVTPSGEVTSFAERGLI